VSEAAGPVLAKIKYHAKKRQFNFKIVGIG
jgi:hypothetical protein